MLLVFPPICHGIRTLLVYQLIRIYNSLKTSLRVIAPFAMQHNIDVCLMYLPYLFTVLPASQNKGTFFL